MKTTTDKVWHSGKDEPADAKWAKFRELMTAEFPSPYRDENDPLAKGIAEAIKLVDNLKQEPGGPAYLGKNSKLEYTYPEVKNVAIPQNHSELDKVIGECVKLFEGMPNVNSPLTMANVWPQPNTASIIASILPLMFMPNIIEGEFAWNVHKAELESAGMLGNLFGWNPKNTGCVYTYGGSGCWFYGVKYALTRVLPDSREKGVRTDAKVLVSTQSHYCRANATDWSGLGMDNIVQIPTDPQTNQMDVALLEAKVKELVEAGTPIASVVCTMGTTDASVFDPIAHVREILDKYPNPKGYGKALLYADAVAGWSWMVFRYYDFENNPLGFSPEVIEILKQNLDIIKGIEYADAIGVDFHKFGFAPYTSSCFVYRDSAEFESIMRRGSYAYLQEVTPYNPMYYTLEVSRSGAGSLAGWATLKYLGLEGLQAILGGILEVRYYFQNLIEKHKNFVCADPDNTGFITLFRVYADGVNGDDQYRKEIEDPAHRAELIRNNELTAAIGEKLFEWYLNGHKVNGKFTPHMAYSTGFRTTSYNGDGTDSQAVVYALKTYPMNVFVTPEVMQHVVDCVVAARDEVMKTL
ncbi:putative L-2,4-diaminobutyrate decarboxylase [Mucinivorans hirudinis]|uniref:Putative L-2,4-diaminobutyrate decarboxylase n=1 Tax=Mucinivorans hirudinis TaxID=1433126 RepID=A0A060R9E2_9BACT|nr:putative L-2,4-diaminobutyrate decarboxylase [Mucinivorans hirudinis]